MEADVFDLVNSALKKNLNQVQLQCEKICGINRLIWSSWSDVLGPELRYVWEVVPSEWPSYPLNDFGSVTAKSETNSALLPQVNNNAKGDGDEFDTFPFQFLQVDVDFLEDSPPTTAAAAAAGAAIKQNLSVDPGMVSKKQNHGRSPSQNNQDSPSCEDRHSIKSNSSSSFTAFDTQDDQYIAYHVLSSEIFRHDFSDSMELKVLRLPDRNLVTGAYMFSAKNGSKRCIHSLAVVMNETRLDWFLKLQPLFRPFFNDLVARLKAVIFTATFEEMLIEMTSSFSYILAVCGDLEHLSFSSRPFDISDTHFTEPNLTENVFLRHCIAATLQCKSQTVVIGTSHRQINKMLRTLAFVTPEDDWVLCKYASVSASFEVNNDERPDGDYCPYLKLQGCLKSQARSVFMQARFSPWPVCIVNVDRKLVFHSLPWKVHYSCRQEALHQELHRLKGESFNRLQMKFEARQFPDTFVQMFLNQMDNLPYGNAARIGYIRQFLRHLALRALALETYVGEMTNYGLERSRLNLRRVRKALDLNAEGDFFAVLAFADKIRPKLAQFLFQ